MLKSCLENKRKHDLVRLLLSFEVSFYIARLFLKNGVVTRHIGQPQSITQKGASGG